MSEIPLVSSKVCMYVHTYVHTDIVPNTLVTVEFKMACLDLHTARQGEKVLLICKNYLMNLLYYVCIHTLRNVVINLKGLLPNVEYMYVCM